MTRYDVIERLDELFRVSALTEETFDEASVTENELPRYAGIGPEDLPMDWRVERGYHRVESACDKMVAAV